MRRVQFDPQLLRLFEHSGFFSRPPARNAPPAPLPQATLCRSRAQQKASGSFYTPKYIVDHVVRETLAPLLRARTLEDAAKLRIVDPACGAGWFLLGAYEYLLNWHLEKYAAMDEPVRRARVDHAPDGWRLALPERKRILSANIFGVDIDSRAAAAARLALWLKMSETFELNSSALDGAQRELGENIVCGDSIIERAAAFSWRGCFQSVLDAGGFDAVIGNPPYGAALPPADKKLVLKNYRCGNSDTAAAFIQKGIELLAPRGRLGFVIPKSFSYASNWARLRDRVLPRLVSITDLGKSWHDVKLEQCAVIVSKGEAAGEYACLVRREQSFERLDSISKTLAAEFGFILNDVVPAEIALAQRIRERCVRLSAVCANQRGAMLQKFIRRRGAALAIGGKQLQRWRLLPDCKRRVNPARAGGEKARMIPGSVLVQNIVAHVENPVDHIKITAAVAPEAAVGFRLLDTVNQLKCRNAAEARAVCAVLNSKLMNWYAYRFVFGRAIRTMHFDAITTDKLPIPDFGNANKMLMRRIGRSIMKLHAAAKAGQASAAAEKVLNELIFQLYGLTPAERELVRRAMP